MVAASFATTPMQLEKTNICSRTVGVKNPGSFCIQQSRRSWRNTISGFCSEWMIMLRNYSGISFHHNFRREILPPNRQLQIVSPRFEQGALIEEAAEATTATASSAAKLRQVSGTRRRI